MVQRRNLSTNCEHLPHTLFLRVPSKKFPLFSSTHIKDPSWCRSQTQLTIHYLFTAMEQQSFISKYKYNYSIFLSFRGKDTRHNFTGHLLKALHIRGITTFFDDKDLRFGDDISPTLLKAIEESRISIIVFSKNYASSTWCLDELVKILECKEKNNQCVWPIFYKVNPSDVRYQSEGSYGKAMAQHESRFGRDSERVLKWRSALSKVANFSGDHFETGHEYEYEFVDKIVKKASLILPSKGFHVEKHVVGVESHLAKVKSVLDMQSKSTVCMLGIHGPGGIGKTTLAKILYNSLVHEFEYATFLSNIREKSLTSLQERLLSRTFGLDYFKFDDVDEGAFELKNRLCNRKVLVMLDNVDNKEQLKRLVGESDWFGSGSRIIVTTRDKNLLYALQVKKIIYEMTELNDHEASELFCWNAFNSSQPPKEFKALSNEVINYAEGLPLALKVIGSNLYMKDLVECQCALEQYKKIPNQEIQSILKISYDGLSEHGKSIFLDIACFFKENRLEDVNDIFNACGFGSEYHIRVLVDKSLIIVDESGNIQMHDLIQSMGREVIRAIAPKRLGKRSRLWSNEDVVRVLQENSGTYEVEGIILESPESKIQWTGDAFKKMKNLRILIVRNAQFSIGPKYLPNTLRVLEWEGYPSTSLPPNFDPKKLVVFKMPHSCFKLEKPLFKKFESMSVMDFSDCQFIIEVPDISGASTLKELIFYNCQKLVEVHNSIGFLNKVIYLSFAFCVKLTSLPSVLEMPSLEALNISYCTNLQRFPDILGNMRLRIWAENIGAKELPDSISGLNKIHLSGSNIVSTSRCIELLSFLRVLFMVRQKKRGHVGITGTASAISSQWTLVYEVPELGRWAFISLVICPADTLANRGYQHRCKGGVLSFWVRNKFPSHRFAFIKENYMKKDTRSAVKCELFINNVEVDFDVLILESCGYSEPLMYSPSHGHLTQGYLQTYLVNGWNYVEIKVMEDLQFSSHNIVIKECGVLFKCDTNMEDVRFEDPNPFMSAGMMPRNVLERATTCDYQGHALLKALMTKHELGDIKGKLQNSRAKKSWHGGEKCKKRAATGELGYEPPKKLMRNQGKSKSRMKKMMLPIGRKRFSSTFLQIHGATKIAKELHIRKKSKITI